MMEFFNLFGEWDLENCKINIGSENLINSMFINF